MDMFLLRSPSIAVTLFGVVAYILWKSFFASSTLPDLPIVGYDPSQWFAWPRTLIRSFTNFRSLYTEAYDKVRCYSIRIHRPTIAAFVLWSRVDAR